MQRIVITVLFLGIIAGAAFLLMPKEAPPPPPPPPPAPPPVPDKPELSGSWSRKMGPLTLSVTRIEVIQRREKEGKILELDITASNQGEDDLRLPIFGYFLILDEKGKGYKGDAALSRWEEGIPAGGERKGTVRVFDWMQPNVKTITVSWSRVFGTREIGGAIEIAGVPVPP